MYKSLRGRPFNSWRGEGWVISGHGELFSSNVVGKMFFSLFSHKLSITFVLHAIFSFRQALAGNFFSKSPTPSRVNWSAPNRFERQARAVRACILRTMLLFWYVNIFDFPFMNIPPNEETLLQHWKKRIFSKCRNLSWITSSPPIRLSLFAPSWLLV